MRKTKDPVVAEVRRAREEVWKEYRRDPKAFRADSERMRKELGLRRSKLKPIAASLKEIKEQKRRRRAD